MKKKSLGVKDKIQIVLYVLFVFTWFISSKIAYLRMGAIFVAAIFSIIEVINIIQNKTIKIDKSILLYILFFVWGLLSITWSSNGGLAINRALDIFFNIIFLIVSYNFYMRIPISKNSFISIFVVIGLLFSLYIFAFYGIGNYFSMLFAGKRIGTHIINVNFIGVVASITFILMIYMLLNKMVKPKLVPLVIIATPIPLITAFGSGSRKAVIGLAVGLALIILLYIRGKITIKKIITTTLVLAVAIISIVLLKDSPFFSTAFKRMELMFSTLDEDSSIREGSTYIRKEYIEEGLKTFSEKPITGVGLDNSGVVTMDVTGKETYLHCNYVELLACLGIVGFFLYYSIYITIMFKSIASMKKEEINALPLIIILIFFVVEIGSVPYFEIKTAMYFTLMLVLLEKQWYIDNNTVKGEKLPQ